MTEEKRRGVQFDPTINLGHLLTFIGFLVAIFTAWTTLDKRVVVLEEARNAQSLVDRHQDAVLGQQMSQIRDSLQDLKSGVQSLNDRMDRKSGP